MRRGGWGGGSRRWRLHSDSGMDFVPLLLPSTHWYYAGGRYANGRKNRGHAAESRPSTRGGRGREGMGYTRVTLTAEKRFSARCNPNARASRSLTTARHPKLICIISACRLQRNAWLRLRGENVRLKRDIRRWCERNGMETRPRRDATRHAALSRSFASTASRMAFAGFRRRSPGTAEIPCARNWNPSFSSPPLICRLSSRSGTRRDRERELDRGTSRWIRRALFCFTRIPMMRTAGELCCPDGGWNGIGIVFFFFFTAAFTVVVVCYDVLGGKIFFPPLSERHLHNILM